MLEPKLLRTPLWVFSSFYFFTEIHVNVSDSFRFFLLTPVSFVRLSRRKPKSPTELESALVAPNASLMLDNPDINTSLVVDQVEDH